MHTLNLLIIPLILISLNFKIEFSYLVALLCSLGAASFIYTQEGLVNILFAIVIFNVIPIVCQRFSLNLRKRQDALQAKKNELKSAHEEMLKVHSVLKQSNNQLTDAVSQIVELYKITRDLSKVLGFKEICTIFCQKLVEYFKFTKCRLVLRDEDKKDLEVKKVFEVEYNLPSAQEVGSRAADLEMLKQSLHAKKTIYVIDRSLALIPLVVENKFLGTLAVEELAHQALENFSILANQFSLEFNRVRFYQKIQELAITDGLTGLFVRRYFLERLQEELKRSSRHKLSVGFLMIDIDHFKQCNDNFGHLTGDAVLKEVGKRIKTCVREIDMAARYGGEEFSVLLPDTDKQGAQQAAERIRLSIAQEKFKAYGEQIDVRVSAGAALYPAGSASLQQLIDKADQALYRAKQQGRNRVVLAQSSLREGS